MLPTLLSLLLFSCASSVQAQNVSRFSSGIAGPTSMPSVHQAITDPADHTFRVDVTDPVACEMMNITFNPSKGTPPFQVMITVEDWWPFTVQLPANYDAKDKALWLYQFPVLTFNAATPNPNMIVSVTDSSGLMANSSRLVQVTNGTNPTCPSYAGGTDFIFYTDRAASQCQDYQVFWSGNYTTPLDVVFLPESAPPIMVPVTDPARGNLTWLVAMSGGTRFLMNMGDRGTFGSGGVSRVNIVGLNEYVSGDCLSNDSLIHQVLPAQTTLGPATVFPDATSTFASLTTADGVVSTVTVRQTIRNGRPLHQGGGISNGGMIAVLVAVGAAIAIGAAVVAWCFFKRQKKKTNIKSWDLPSDPSAPFNANSNLPIAPGIFGVPSRFEDRHRLDSDDGSSSIANNRRSTYHDPGLASSRGMASHASSNRGSLRSLTSSAFEAMGLAGHGSGRARSSGDAYALATTSGGPGTPINGGETARTPHRFRTGNLGENRSPADAGSDPFTPYADDLSSPDAASAWSGYGQRLSHFGSNSNSVARDEDFEAFMLRNGRRPPGGGRERSSKTIHGRVGSGPTHRADTDGVIYHDLLSSSPPASGMIGSYHNTMPTAAAGDAGLAYDSMSGGGRNYHHHFNMTAQSSISGSDFSSADMMRNESYGGANARIIRHADAGLLLDDSVDSEGQLMEPPPQYETISRPATSPLTTEGRPSRPAGATAPRATAVPLSTKDVGTAGIHEDDDEDDFWTGPAATLTGRRP